MALQSLSSFTPFARGKSNKALPCGEMEGGFLSFCSLHEKVPIILPFPLSKPLKILSCFQMLKFSPSFQLGVVFLFWDLLLALDLHFSYTDDHIPSFELLLFASPDFKFFEDMNQVISKNFLWLLEPCFLYGICLTNICWMNQLINTIKAAVIFCQAPLPVIQSVFAPGWDLETKNKLNGDKKKL